MRRPLRPTNSFVSRRRGNPSRASRVGRFIELEALEPRQLLTNVPPRILGIEPGTATATEPSSLRLLLSEPVVGADACNASTYQLLNLGPNRVLGGGDDTVISVSPGYADGSNAIDLLILQGNQVNLAAWSERDYATLGAGDWRIETGGSSVKQYINGDPTFFVSDFDFIDQSFTGRMKVETTNDDDFIGLVFGFQTQPSGIYQKPDDYYYFSWKQGNQPPGESGMKLLRASSRMI